MSNFPPCRAARVTLRSADNARNSPPRWARARRLFGSLAAALACIAGQGRAADATASPSLAEVRLEELMNMRVTTVSREESTIGQSPAAIFVVTPEMMRRSGASSDPELLRMVPGLEVGHIDSSKSGVALSGFNTRFANKLLVQVDGRTVYTLINGGVYWDTVDYVLEDIECIEVVRGPGGSTTLLVRSPLVEVGRSLYGK